MNELGNLSKKVSHKVKQKMRLGEIKRAVKNTRDIDSYLHRLEQIIESNHLRVLAEIDDLRKDSRRQRERLLNDLDAIIKYRVNALQDQLLRKPSYIDSGKFVLFSSSSMELVIPSEDAGLIAYVERHGAEFIEPGTCSVIQSLLAAGDVAVDIGANCGIHAVVMGKAVGETGIVYAFEPTPNVAAALRFTALLSGLRHMQIYPMAVLDKPKRTKLFSFNHSPENSVFAIFDVNAHSVTSIDVEACSLDSFFPEGTRVDLVKADVEGAEPLVFKGMQRVIQENPQIKIVMEMSPSHFERSGISLKEFFSLLLEQGFVVQAIDENNGSLHITDLDEIAQVETANVLIRKA
jgi:FkbM family methyltransferase